jgi:hypothetical protein
VDQTVGTFINAALATDSSDAESYVSTVDSSRPDHHIQDRTSPDSSSQDPSTIDHNTSDHNPGVSAAAMDLHRDYVRDHRRSFFKTGMNFLQSWRQQANNGSPGRPIKIFTTNASGSNSTGQAFHESEMLDTSRSNKSITSSYATCIDADEWLIPSPPPPPRDMSVNQSVSFTNVDKSLGGNPDCETDLRYKRKPLLLASTSAITTARHGVSSDCSNRTSFYDRDQGISRINDSHSTRGELSTLDSSLGWLEELSDYDDVGYSLA